MQKTAIPQLVVVCMLVWAWHPDNAYEYYIFLRWVCCAMFAWLTWTAHKGGHREWVWLFGAGAAIYNPILPVHLSRANWQLINAATIGIVASSLLVLGPNLAGWSRKGEWPKIRSVLRGYTAVVVCALFAWYLSVNRELVGYAASGPINYVAGYIPSLFEPAELQEIKWKRAIYKVTAAEAAVVRNYPDLAEIILQDKPRAWRWEDLTYEQRDQVTIRWGSSEVPYQQIIDMAGRLDMTEGDLLDIGAIPGLSWEDLETEAAKRQR